ncbi:hypothetical protein D1632_17825 [Chryseobacterium nematophagum]|uniref:Uncharacterized protein n=1 Tax=Chryseobacterium nematophagum TaxID=2305228 RepID=A0A3M7L9M0_9FLAO|nr:hypothetical protein [Chryseobacterium nematophagum]RMZ58146.1 hypothetical protein D1632_17825 [Chryseobacterium nematophagum]
MRPTLFIKKILISILVFGCWNLYLAQEKALIKLLNRELKKEVKNQLKSPNFNGDTISIVQEFNIDNKNNLTFQIKKTSPYFKGYQIIKQEVPLAKIRNIGKDIQIILEAEPNTVITTTVDQTQQQQTITGSLFFLYLSHEKENEDLGHTLQKTFKKAGYIIGKEYWYD